MIAGAWGRVALVAAGVVALDQATKALVRATLERGERVAVFPGVELVDARNTGVAFGALSGGGAVVTAVVAVALVALFALAGFRRGLVGTALSLAGIVGGAILGSRLAPHFLHGGSSSRWAAVAAIAGVHAQ
jgi:signal peptidase II